MICVFVSIIFKLFWGIQSCFAQSCQKKKETHLFFLPFRQDLSVYNKFLLEYASENAVSFV